jgi:hypothetical protein
LATNHRGIATAKEAIGHETHREGDWQLNEFMEFVRQFVSHGGNVETTEQSWSQEDVFDDFFVDDISHWS